MIETSAGPASLAALKEKETMMRNMNQLKRKCTPAALACALALAVMLVTAPAWAYVVHVQNKTDKTVSVEVFLTTSVGKIPPMVVKKLAPNGSLNYTATKLNCIKYYKGWYLAGTPKSQYWTLKANPNGVHCESQRVLVKRDGNGKFYFEIQ